jgi:membrane-associated phospholipid phosphatase
MSTRWNVWVMLMLAWMIRVPTLHAALQEPAIGVGGAPDASQGQQQPPPIPEKPEDIVAPAITSLRTLARDVVADFKHLPSRQTFWILAAGGAVALSVHPADTSVNARLSDDDGVFKAGKVIGNTGTLLGMSLGTWAVGKLAGNHDMSHIGLDAIRAIGESEAVLQTMKYTIRRERPDHSGGYAFPSGHAADTFAVASVVQRHLNLKWSILAYTASSYVAMSRLHDNKHYLSDVVFGAALGTVVGRNVTRHGSSNFSFFPMAVPGGGALALFYSRK